MHVFYFLVDISSNEVFNFHQAMKQDDWIDFVTEMEEKIEDQKSKIEDDLSILRSAKIFQLKPFCYQLGFFYDCFLDEKLKTQ